VTGIEAPRIGEIAAAAGIVLHELTPRLASLEEAFMELTAGSTEFGVTGPAGTGPAGTGPAGTGPPGAPGPGEVSAPTGASQPGPARGGEVAP
jgi:ABC-2 type transport system ATP-binding protein